MSGAKLHINLAQGILDVEGDVDFVREVYNDYREGLFANSSFPIESSGTVAASAENSSEAAPSDRGSRDPANGRKKRKPSVPKVPKEGGSGISSFKPSLVGGLDTKDLKSFFGQYESKSHYDNIVIFTLYLEDKGISPASFNQIYTCYRDAQIKTPVAFAQAFIDARGNKRAFIDFTDATNVTLTERGRNHGQFGGIKKKTVEPA